MYRSLQDKRPWALFHNSQYLYTWAFTRDRKRIPSYGSIFIHPCKIGTWALTREWVLTREWALTRDTMVHVHINVSCSTISHLFIHASIHVQVIALGVILHRGSYLRGFFNSIDCFVVISSLIPIMFYIINSDAPPSTER